MDSHNSIMDIHNYRVYALWLSIDDSFQNHITVIRVPRAFETDSDACFEDNSQFW